MLECIDCTLETISGFHLGLLPRMKCVCVNGRYKPSRSLSRFATRIRLSGVWETYVWSLSRQVAFVAGYYVTSCALGKRSLAQGTILNALTDHGLAFGRPSSWLVWLAASVHSLRAMIWSVHFVLPFLKQLSSPPEND